jgi:Outer membrane protein beta-barrel domain
MKKILSLLTLLSVISVGVYAQGISGGLKLGLNLANQTIKSSDMGFTASPSFRPSIHAGGYLTVMLNEKFGIQPEVLYSGQGYKQNGGTLAMDYITIPVLFRYNFTPIFSAHLGPQMGFLMSAKAKYDGADEEDMKDYFKGSDIGIAGGVNIDLPMGLNFAARFVKGVSNIIEEDSGDLKYKNYNLQLSVGYKLFGKK